MVPTQHDHNASQIRFGFEFGSPQYPDNALRFTTEYVRLILQSIFSEDRYHKYGITDTELAIDRSEQAQPLVRRLKYNGDMHKEVEDLYRSVKHG